MSEKAEEDKYFYQINRELIEERQREEEEAKTLKFPTLKCPKCGELMRETMKGELRFEKCRNCTSVWIEWEDFQTLIKPQAHRSFYEIIDEQLQPDEHWIADL